MTALAEHPMPAERVRDRREYPFAIGVSFLAALLAVAPFFWLGNASGHDIAFHASSWMDVAGQWREGVFYPRWAEWANHGFGEPRFLFYPPLSWMLGAVLNLLVPGNAVAAVFIVLAETLAGVCAFALARRLLPIGAALLAAACQAANPYALLIIYMRSDFAELLACALMPVLTLAALELSGWVEACGRSWTRTTAFFAVTFAAVWLSNAPAGVMASYSVALVFVCAAVGETSFGPLWRGAGGLALGFGLTSFYLLPAAYEQRWVHISQALSSGLLPAENFLYTRISDPEHNAFNSIASSVAVLLIFMTAIAALGARPRRTGERENEDTGRLWRMFLMLSVVAVLLMLRGSLIFWERLPELRFVQFPWRWMAILAVPYGYLMAAALSRRRRAGWVWGIAILGLTAGTASILVHKAYWDSEDFPALEEAIANDQGFEGTDEYDPLGDDRSNLPGKAPRVEILPAKDFRDAAPKAEVRIERWTAEKRDIRVTTDKPVRAVLRLLNYPAWSVTLNGRTVTPQHPEGSAQMMVSIPAGESRIEARFIRTKDRTLGGILSLLSLIILFAMVSLGRQPPSGP